MIKNVKWNEEEKYIWITSNKDYSAAAPSASSASNPGREKILGFEKSINKKLINSKQIGCKQT